MKRRWIAACAVGLLTGLGAAPPVHAAPTSAQAPRTAWTYTDLRRPLETLPVGVDDVALGAWHDDQGRFHSARLYATFDLRAFQGKDIHRAVFSLTEVKVTKCPLRSMELWETELPATPPTWLRPPSDKANLGSFTSSACPASHLTIDIAAAVRAALAQGRTSLAIAVRVGGLQEFSTHYGRWISGYEGLRLSVTYNTAPRVDPTRLYQAYRPCATMAPGPIDNGGGTLQALVQDDDAFDTLAAEFAIWPQDRPADRVTFTREDAISGRVASANVPFAPLSGKVYAWQARASDGLAHSAWSPVCYFTADADPPTQPVVASENYPPGSEQPGGVPAEFVFRPGSSTDVAAYQLTWDEFAVPGYELDEVGAPVWHDPFGDPGYVRAAADGTATVRLSPPMRGFNVLRVRSFDAAGNSSGSVAYEVFVGNTTPSVSADIGSPAPGQPVTLTFSPHENVTGVQRYTYSVDGRAELEVAAGADGIARVVVSFPSGMHRVEVSSHSANGWVSPRETWTSYVETSPTVVSETYPENEDGGGVGVAGLFTFGPRAPHVTAFHYSFDYKPYLTAAPGPDGTASVSWTPGTSGYHSLRVFTTTASGEESDVRYYDFYVA